MTDALQSAGAAALMDSARTAPAAPLPRRKRLPGTARSVQDARRFVRAALHDCPRADDLAQAVTELASNAVAWSAAGEGGTFTVTIRRALRSARIEVTDPGPARHPVATSNGWGLNIVATLTDRSGITHGPGSTCTAWAETHWTGPPAT